jgi:hypothetical protein
VHVGDVEIEALERGEPDGVELDRDQAPNGSGRGFLGGEESQGE